MGAERWDEQVGSVADEASRLLESLRRSVAENAAGAENAENAAGAEDNGGTGAQTSGGAERSAPSAADGDVPRPGAGSGPDAAPHDPLCTWCPLCRGAAVVRSLSPETLGRLADVASLAATVLADLASSRTAAQQPAPATPEQADTDTADPRDNPSTRVPARTHPRRTPAAPSRPIPVHDADDPQEEPRG